MKTRTLFLTLITSFSILLITNGLAFAETITGCLQKSTGKIYNGQIGTEPTLPCASFDQEISWNQEGPAGADGTGCTISGSLVTCANGISDVRGPEGPQGPAGPEGPPGPAGTGGGGGAPQFILRASNGNEVGTVVTISGDNTSAIFPFPDLLFVENKKILTRVEFPTGGNSIPIGLRVEPAGIRFQHQLLFKEPNCGGIRLLIPCSVAARPQQRSSLPKTNLNLRWLSACECSTSTSGTAS